MNGSELIRPTKELVPQIKAFRDEFLNSLDWLHGAQGLRYIEDPEEWLEYSKRLENEETVPNGSSPYTQFVYLRKTDMKIVGMLGVRHRPTEPIETWGGHVGYCVCPSERRKGYAKAMLRDVLPYCKSIGLDRILLTAGDENQGSVRTILANGGVLENYVLSPRHQIMVGRYWIET